MVRRRPGSAIDNIKGVTSSPKGESRATDAEEKKKEMSEKERKIMRDAFNLFDTDGDGSVTKDELKHVMQTLFNTELSEEELDKMVSDVDKDNDGEVSFEEFQAKVQSVINETQRAESTGSPVQNTHWHSLSKLISQFSEAEQQKGQASGASLVSRVTSVGHTKKHKRRERRKKEKSNQHDAMVAHFNLRRLSVDNQEEQGDDMERAIKAIAEQESKKLKHMIRRPMNPSSTFRRSWELMVLVLVLFQAIYIPLTVSFRINHERASSWWWFDLWADIIFMTDLVMTFNVGIINNNNKLVMDRRVIAKTYLKGWFLLDLAASVPFDLIIEAFEDEEEVQGQGGNTASATSLLKGFKLPRLLRLLKIMRLMRLVKFAKIRPEIIWWFQYSRHSNLLRLFTLVIGVIVVIHYMTCFFFPVMQNKWLSRLDCEDLTLPDFEDYIGDASLHDAVGYGDGAPLQSCTGNTTSVATQYATAFYNSMLLIQGEHIDPKSVEEKLYCSMLILIGSLVLALIFGNVSMYIANFSANATAYQRKMEYLFESMNHLELPQNLKKRIIMYYDHIWKEYRSLDGQVYSFIPELSKQLSSEVYLYLRTNLILSVPFLRQCSPEIVQRLVTALCTEVFLPNDYIVHKGVPGEEMYLISRGTCEVTITDFTARMEDVESGIKSRGPRAPGKRKKSSFLGLSIPVLKSSPEKREGGIPKRKSSLSGRRRSSIVGAMAAGVEKMQELVARGSDGNDSSEENDQRRRRMSRKGILPPERDSATGLLKEAKSFSDRGGLERDDSVRSSAGEQEKRDKNFREQRKHSIDYIPNDVDMMQKIEEHAEKNRNKQEKEEEAGEKAKAKQSEGKKKTISFFTSEKGKKDNESVMSDDTSDDGGGRGRKKNNGEITLRAPSRVGQVEARNIAFPMMKGMSMGNVSVVPVGGDPSSGTSLGGGSDKSSDSASTNSNKLKGAAGGGGGGFSPAKSSGGVKIRDLIKTEKVVKELLEGDYFGEIALILNTTRTCNVRAKTFVELNILKRNDFEDVVGKYKEERGLMEEIIMEKYKVEVSNLEKNKRSEKKDIPAMLQCSIDSGVETRLMIDTLSQQVALITQSLIMSDVIKLDVGGISPESAKRGGGGIEQAQELSRKLSQAMGVSGSNRSLAATNSGRSIGGGGGPNGSTPPRQLSREGSFAPPSLVKLNSIKEKKDESNDDSGRTEGILSALDVGGGVEGKSSQAGKADSDSPGSGETETLTASTNNPNALSAYASESISKPQKTYTEEEYNRRFKMPSEEFNKLQAGDLGLQGDGEDEEFDELVKSIDLGE
ncbi:hypothetical protein TrVE_jg3233 [Triparma verrucosa]|uniref:Calmodulin n=1 Tax=Triparma verrucosa TaxID=1606542 RepID=A0A9W7C3Q4_9STRA|nr:hypothetical protein TrVE_jg3233 [Triparma verrucosa]